MKTQVSGTYQRYKDLQPTGPDIEGPFYKAGAPDLVDGKLDPNPSLCLTGIVKDVCGTPLCDVVLDFWQADASGVYDETGFRLRGKIHTCPDGSYRLETVKPGFYPISDTEFRCSHIHVKLWRAGVLVLMTQLYFANDPHDDTDEWFDLKRCITFADSSDKSKGSFDFILSK